MTTGQQPVFYDTWPEARFFWARPGKWQPMPVTRRCGPGAQKISLNLIEHNLARPWAL